MSDQSAQEAAVEQSETATTPPWGDDFDAAKAWQTITHLRGREKELEPLAKRLERASTDEDARRELLAEWGYEVEDDDDDDDEYEEAPTGGESESDLARRIAGIEQKIQSQETQQATNERLAMWNDWETFVKEQAKEQGLELSARDIKALKLDCVSDNGWPVPPEKATAVLKTHIEDVNTWLDEQVKQRRKNPRASAVPGGPGAPADGEPPTGHEQRVAAAVAALRTHDSGS